MDAQQLYLADGRSAGVWYCGKCRCVFKTFDSANDCCTCRYCGKVIEDKKAEYTGSHRACVSEWHAKREREQLDRAVEVDVSEHGFFVDDTYCPSMCEVVDLLSEWEPENRPQFVFCAVREEFPEIDASRLVEHIFEDLYEDAYDDAKGMAELQAACDAFREANKSLVTFSEDRSRKCRVPEITEDD